MNEALIFVIGVLIGATLVTISATITINRLHRKTDAEIERIYVTLERREQDQS